MDYRLVCEALCQAGFRFQTFSEPAYTPSQRCAFDFTPPSHPLCLLRHDVDHDTRPALEMGRVEASFGIRSTYFILTTDSAASVFQNPDTRSAALEDLQALAALGHEIGLHYDPLGDFFADGIPVSESIAQALDCLRSTGLPVTTCAAHGSGRLRKLAGGPSFPLHLANYRVWQEFPHSPETAQLNGRHLELPALSLARFGLQAEVYQTRKDHYLSDSGGYLWRTWEGQDQPFEQIDSQPGLDLPAWLAPRAQPSQVTQVLIHPVWWIKSLPLDRHLYSGVTLDLTHSHCLRVRQHESNGARLTVGLPLRQAAAHGWLPLESLASQQPPGVPWELIVLEDESDPAPLGREALLAYQKRLHAAGCVAVRWETLPDPLQGGPPALSLKWKRLGALASASSEVFLLQTQEEFAAPNCLRRTWRQFQAPQLDATFSTRGLLLDLGSPTPNVTHSSPTEPAPVLNLALRTRLVRELPHISKNSQTSAWLLATAADLNRAPLVTHPADEDPDFIPSLSLKGFKAKVTDSQITRAVFKAARTSYGLLCALRFLRHNARRAFLKPAAPRP